MAFLRVNPLLPSPPLSSSPVNFPPQKKQYSQQSKERRAPSRTDTAQVVHDVTPEEEEDQEKVENDQEEGAEEEKYQGETENEDLDSDNEGVEVISRPTGAVLLSSTPSDLRLGVECSKPPGNGRSNGGDKAGEGKEKEEGVEVVGSRGALVLPHMRFCCPEVELREI